MNNQMIKLAAVVALGFGSLAWAGTASSSAGVTGNRWGPGTAVASAEYDGGGRGWARTNTDSDRGLARGIAYGVDRDGISLSSSYAAAPKRGPATAGTFNLAIGRDGSVSRSTGRTVVHGGGSRSVEAGGFARPGSAYRPASAGATVRGRAIPSGRVVSATHSGNRIRPGSGTVRHVKKKVIRRVHRRRVIIRR